MTPQQFRRTLDAHKRDERTAQSVNSVLILISLPFIAVVVLVIWRVLF